MKQQRSPRGFSLLEILAVVSLMIILAAVSVVNLRQGSHRGQTSGLAELVAEELRGARFRAISQNVPVAVAFPSASGTTGHSQGLYVLEGNQNPRVVRSSSYSSDFPDSHIFVGSWPTTYTSSHDDVQVGVESQDYSVAQWGVPNPKDYVIMFTPAGGVKTNGLTNFKGGYHVVVSNGLSESPTIAPTGKMVSQLKYFQLDSVASPITLSISPAGSVTSETGLIGSTSVAISNRSIVTANQAKPAATSASGGNSDPVIIGAKIETTATSAISPHGQSSITVEASDPDGDPLFLQCISIPAKAGKFSSGQPTRMDWVAEDSKPGHYRACWVWTPPEVPTAGQIVGLDYQISDGKGGFVTGTLVEGTDRSKPKPLRVAFLRDMKNGSFEVASTDSTGTSVKNLSPLSDRFTHWYTPSFSKDGKQLAFWAHPDNMDYQKTQMCICNSDGSGFKKVLTGPARIWPARWTPDATKLVCATDRALIWIDPKTGSQNTILKKFCHNPQISPKQTSLGHRVLFTEQDYDYSVSGYIMTLSTARLNDGGDLRQVLKLPPDEQIMDPMWSVDGKKIFFARTNYKPNDPNNGLWTMDADGSNLTQILRCMPYSQDITPDGKLIIFTALGPGDQAELRAIRFDGSHPDSLVPGNSKFLTQCLDNYPWMHSVSPYSDAILFMDKNYMLSTINILGPQKVFVFPASKFPRFDVRYPTWGVK